MRSGKEHSIKLLYDLDYHGHRAVVARGGKHGVGNRFLKSMNKSNKQKGELGEEKELVNYQLK